MEREVKIDFASRKLQKSMEGESSLKKTYGKLASALKRRLAILDSATCLDDVPTSSPDWCHELKGKRAGTFAVEVSGNYRLIFEPDHDPVPLLGDGGIDLKTVTAVKILEVSDYHGK
tara:strand:- start:2124 stop:2474 length:351 start_codon:yes stop_codon:yes gene_type:complete